MTQSHPTLQHTQPQGSPFGVGRAWSSIRGRETDRALVYYMNGDLTLEIAHVVGDTADRLIQMEQEAINLAKEHGCDVFAISDLGDHCRIVLQLECV